MKYKPSKAAQLVGCPGSVALQIKFPEPEDQDRTSAEEGTASHWYAEQALKEKVVSVGDAAPNGVVITEEMARAAEMYMGTVLESSKKLLLEKQVTIPVLGGAKGLVDAVDYCADTKTLTIYDYKYGHSVVEVERNWQLFCYYDGLREFYPGGFQVVFCIVQPRAAHVAGPVRIWRPTKLDLLAMAKTLNERLSESKLTKPPTQAGLHCHYCSAGAHCASLQQAVVTDLVSQVGSSVTNVMDPCSLALALQITRRLSKLIKTMDSALTSRAEQLIAQGQSVPGWTVVPQQGNLKWDRPVSDVVDFANNFGVKVLKPAALITPAQCKQAGLPEALVDAMASRATSSKLSPVDLGKVASVFPLPEDR